MCGIGGCVVPAGETPDRSALDRMLAALHHRGPDDRGVAIVDSVGLVHTRLAIVDPSPAGHQPMRHPDGDWVLTYNGEIFNHLELRASLPSIPYVGGSDTETLIHALAHWGEAAVPRCNGLYAFAAIDRRRHRLLLVRDRFGVKPLYYAHWNGAIWFASEIGALLEAGIPRRAQAGLVEHFLTQNWVNGSSTLIEGVRQLLPGSLLEVDLATLRVSERTWYDPADAVDADLQVQLSAEARPASTEALEDRLRAAVKRRLMADVPVGTMCSGGIDSSLITKLARDEHPQVYAFNASVSDQPEVDEASWAEVVARHIGIDLHTVRMTAESWRADLVDVVRHVEYPLTHESSVPMSQIADLARSLGVKVLLSGEGADELFGGYDWLAPRDYIDFVTRREGLLPHTTRLLRSAYRRNQRRRAGGTSLESLGRGPAPEPKAYESQLVRRGLAAYAHHRGVRRRLEAGLLADLGSYLPHLLNRDDKTTMRCSVETRVPFLDPEVVALALNLPLEHRIEPRRKGVLRELSDRHLPASIAQRRKVGFGFDARRYFDGHIRPEFLTDGRLRELLGARAGRYPELGHAAHAPGLAPLTAEIWCRLLLDGSSVPAVERELWR